ncbi:hypothetical protein D9M71_84920 [compost metagenome]
MQLALTNPVAVRRKVHRLAGIGTAIEAHAQVQGQLAVIGKAGEKAARQFDSQAKAGVAGFQRMGLEQRQHFTPAAALQPGVLPRGNERPAPYRDQRVAVKAVQVQFVVPGLVDVRPG